MLGDPRNRGPADALIVCCDGLRGLPESIRMTWPKATVQTCVVYMVRNSLRYASKTHRGPTAKSMRATCTSPTKEAAETLFEAFAQDWEHTCTAMIRAWRNSWDESTPLLELPAELRRAVHTTNAVESLNARYRRAARHRGHYPNEQAPLKALPRRHRQAQRTREPHRQDQRLEDHTEHPDRPPQRPDRRPHQLKTITTAYTKKLTVRPLERARPPHTAQNIARPQTPASTTNSPASTRSAVTDNPNAPNPTTEPA